MKNKYLIVKGCAGLGNRLITVWSAIQYAKKTNRILVIDWRDGQFDIAGQNAFTHFFNLNNVETCLLQNIPFEKSSSNSIFFSNNSNLGVYDGYAEKINNIHHYLKKILFTPHLKKIHRKWAPSKLNPYNETLNYGSDLNIKCKHDIIYYIDFLPQISLTCIDKHIILKSEIENIIINFSESHHLNQHCGIHIRNTDKKPTTHFNNLFKYLKESSINTVFLSTDDSSIENLFKEKVENVICYPKQKVVLTTEGLHQWALYAKADNMKKIIYQESVIDMFLLSKCKTLLYQGNSSFSVVAKAYQHSNQTHIDWQTL